MANSDKDIIITPNRSSSTDDPKVEFRGANSTVGPYTITSRVYPTSNGTLSFEGSAGQLFSITNSLSGTLFSVNDVSGVPSIEVLDTGVVKLAQYSGSVLVGTSTNSGNATMVLGGGSLDFGLRNTTSTKGRWARLEGVADASGEGSARLFFTENNNASSDLYGVSFTYNGTGSSPVFPSGMTLGGSNAEWAFWGHDNSLNGSKIMYGYRNETNVYASGSFRAPIFYDSNDTSYYADPASTSYFNSMYIAGGVGGISNSSSYTEAAIEVRERGFGGAQDDTWATAPRISFHWGGRVASQIGMGSNGRIWILNNPGNAAENFQAANIYGTAFIDSNDNNYYLDPTSTTSLRTVGSWRSDSSTWDGEFAGKIQYHSSHWYFQGAGQWIFRNAAGSNVAYFDNSGNLNCAYVSGSYFNASSGNSENPTIGQIWTQNTTDNYLRKSTPAHFISNLGILTTSNWTSTITTTQGIQGIQGRQGIQGIQGNAGTNGTNGTNGSQGVQGIQGISGTNGTNGSNGSNGSQGIQGIQGRQGIQGNAGTNGTNGTNGSQGVQGIQGITGATGGTGGTGSQGIQGIQGRQGIQGITGTNGTNGTNGSQGIQGIQGSAGSGVTTATPSTVAQRDSLANIYANNFYSVSDSRLKENITPIYNPTFIIQNLKGVRYNRIGSNIPQTGLLAQDLEKVLPEAVTTNGDIKLVSYDSVTGVIVEAIKEQSEMYKKQEQRINRLEELLTQIASKVLH